MYHIKEKAGVKTLAFITLQKSTSGLNGPNNCLNPN